MKKDIHPENYRLVVFKDLSCDYSFLTKSTVETKDTVVWDDGNEYPLYNIEISNNCLLYTSPSPRDDCPSRMPSSA